MLPPVSAPPASGRAPTPDTARMTNPPIAVSTNKALRKNRMSPPLRRRALRSTCYLGFVTPDRRGRQIRRERRRGSELVLFDDHRLVARGRDPFLHLPHRPD